MELEIKIPTKWDELTDWQLIKIASMLHKSGPPFDFMTWLYLNEVKWYQFKKAYELRQVINNVPLSELRTHFNWIFTNVNRTKFPKHKKYKSPMDRMVNLTIEEFAVADDLNNNYLKTRNILYLRLLTSVLYKKGSDQYNHLLLDTYSKRFKKDKNSFFKAVHIAFNGCKKGIVEKYPNIYPKIKVQQKSNKKSGLLDVVLKMSGQKFGTYEETKRTLLYTFLNDMEESIIQNKELKEQYEKKRKS